MKTETRIALVNAVDDLRVVREKLATIAHQQQALDKAAAEHRAAVRGDLDALFEAENRCFERITDALNDATKPAPETWMVVEELRWGRR